jgi:hypothetical protein
MSKKIIAIQLILFTISAVLIAGCYKVTTLVAKNEQEVTTQVSLKGDLIPVFTQSCSKSGCHNNGGIKPDLSPDKAYNSLINGNYVNLTSADNSEIYLWLTGRRATPMPVGEAGNPSNINQLILAWIRQGGKNN